MDTFEEFAQKLVLRSQHVLVAAELESLARDRFADVGTLPTAGDSDRALAILVSNLREIHEPIHLGRVVLFAGYLVEHGADAGEIAPLVAERIDEFMAKASAALRAAPDENDVMRIARAAAQSDPDAASAILGTEPMVAGTMMLLCRQRPALQLARRSQSLVPDARLVGACIFVADLLAELLECSDHEQVAVIHPTRHVGVLVDVDGVRNGFHLFTLLQDVLVGDDGCGVIGGIVAPEHELNIARGQAVVEADQVFQARFDHFNWSAWGPDGWEPDGPTRWIWGELPLACIPKVRKLTIILIDEPTYIRTYSASLACAVHPEQRPDVRLLRTLSSEEIDQWLSLFASAPRVTRDRMRYAGVQVA